MRTSSLANAPTDLLRRAVRLALAGGLCLTLNAALAQDTDEDDEAEGQATEEPQELEDIQVTARLRTESLRDVPIAVTAFSGQELEDRGAQDITYLNQAVPNVTVEVSRGTNSTLTTFIRGVGQQDPVAGFEAGVGVYLDDVYLNRPQMAVLDIYDVERIEVLRGPQGTLYGRNTIGGAIKYVTKRLGHEPSLSLEGEVGSYSQVDLVASGELPVTDTLSVGASVASFKRSGYGENLFLGYDHYNKDVQAARFSAEWTPVPELFVRLSGDYTQDDSNPKSGHRLIPGLFSGAPVLDDVYDTRAGISGPRPHEADQSGATLLAEYDLNANWMLKNVTAYREDENFQQIDFEALPAEDVDVPVLYKNRQFSQELQLHYSGDRTDGVLGFYYLDANAFNAFDVILAQTGEVIGLPGLNAFTLGDVDTESWSVFSDVTYDIGDYLDMDTGLELSVGGRYTEDKRSSRVLRQTMIGGNSPFLGGDAMTIATTSDFEGSETFTDFTPRVSLSWEPDPDHNLYASFSEGFKGGSFDPRGATTAAPDLDGDGNVSEDEVFQFMKFEPETVETVELGAKSLWADGRATTSLAVFHSDYSDVQVPGSVGVDTDGDGVADTFTGVTTNAGAATVQGVEFEGNASLGRDVFTDGDVFRTGWALGWIDAEYDRFITAINDPTTGDDVLENVADERVFQNTPEWTAHWNLRYDRPMNLFGMNGDFSVIGAWSYRSETHQFEIPNEFLDQDAYSLYDLNLIWATLDGKYEVGLHGRNLTDEEYKVAGYNFASPDGTQSTLGLEGVLNAFYGPPRTVSATFKVNF